MAYAPMEEAFSDNNVITHKIPGNGEEGSQS